MVAVSAADVPFSKITTVEALSVWCAAVLNNLHFQQEITEAPGVIEKVAVSQTFPINNNGTYEWRVVSRTSCKLNSTFQYSGKLWESVVPLSNASIPNDFKS